MDLSTIKEIMACLPKDRTFFYYFKDRYALLRLAALAQQTDLSISTLRQSPYAPLLDKPLVKQVLANCGRGMVRAQDLLDYWPAKTQTLLLKLGHWGGDEDRRWQQTCRPGYNLVLQLLFANDHDRQYRRLFRPRYDGYFNYSCHPIAKRHKKAFYRETLAWARIDLDWHTGEALIEEIQSDWISDARRLLKKLQQGDDLEYEYGIQGQRAQVLHYLQTVLADYAKLWDEAMLSAALNFIQQELGLKNVFYHEFTTGAALKGMTDCLPPRSLYSKLPRRFCLQPVKYAPEFLQRDKTCRRVLKKIRHPVFFIN